MRGAMRRSHGFAAGAIAGAGVGKTNTLARRVAHLPVNGVLPESLMLLTFSLRAADEMTRWVQRIVAQVSPRFATMTSDGFDWPGTARSTVWSHGYCVSTPRAAGLIRRSRETIAKTQPV